jgi:sec-independent protein translocase protein TatC
VQSIAEHLDELKRRFKVSILSFAVLLAIFMLAPANPFGGINITGTYVPFVAFFLARIKLDLLPPGWELIAGAISDPLKVYIVGSLVLALVFNSPIFGYEVVKFVNPALKESEKKLVYPFVAASSTLFVVGVLFGYFFLAKFLFIALQPFYQTAQAVPIISVADFYSIVFLVIAMSGFSFTTPVYVFLLIRFRVVAPETFSKNRVIIWIVVYIATAIVTPDGGPLLDIILFVPIIVLLELAVWLAKRTLKGLPKDRCSYCGALLGGAFFCPNCGKAST